MAKFTRISQPLFKTKPRRCFGYQRWMEEITFSARFSWCSWRFGSERAVWSWFVHIPVPEVSSRCSCLLSQSGCSFGGRFYSLEDTWHPDLGEPFGVMHCVMCHCEPVRRQTHSAFHNRGTFQHWPCGVMCSHVFKCECILFLFKHAKYV